MTRTDTISTAPGWGDPLSGGNLIRSLPLSGGVALHAVDSSRRADEGHFG